MLRLLILFLFLTPPLFASMQNVQNILGEKYKVERLLSAEGGESDVYLVKNTKGQTFAAKYWVQEKKHDHFRLDPFQNSLVIHRALKNEPWLVKCFDVIGDVMILEYIDGQTLKHYLEKPHTEKEKRAIAKQLSVIYQTFFERNIIPWDTDLNNILITKNGHIKIIDPAAFIKVDELITINTQHYPKNDFGLFKKAELQKILQKLSRPKAYKLNGKDYPYGIPLMLYSTLAAINKVYMHLLETAPFKKRSSLDHLQTFGFSQKRLQQKAPKKIKHDADENLLSRALLPSYTQKDFLKDVQTTKKLFQEIQTWFYTTLRQ